MKYRRESRSSYSRSRWDFISHGLLGLLGLAAVAVEAAVHRAPSVVELFQDCLVVLPLMLMKGATVWWDADSDGVLDDDEVFTTTDTDGSFLDGVGSGGYIVISGGVDIDTCYRCNNENRWITFQMGWCYVTPITLFRLME